MPERDFVAKNRRILCTGAIAQMVPQGVVGTSCAWYGVRGSEIAAVVWGGSERDSSRCIVRAL